MVICGLGWRARTALATATLAVYLILAWDLDAPRFVGSLDHLV
jgi:hypothetical protein